MGRSLRYGMQGVILAGGQGTRLSPLTKVANKHLLPVYDKPMIHYPINTLMGFGVTDICIITGGEYVGRFAEYLGDGSDFGCSLTYKVQEKAGGVAHALALAESFVKRDVLAILGDNIFESMDHMIFSENMATIFIKQIDNPGRFGVVELEGNTVIGIEEKPKHPKSSMVVTGLYHYPKDVFDVIRTLEPSERGELEITDVNNHYIKEGRLQTEAVKGFWSDAGTVQSLLDSSNWSCKQRSK